MSRDLYTGGDPGGDLGVCWKPDASHTDYLPLPANPDDPHIVIPITGVGDMFRAVYDQNKNGVVDRVDKVLISEVEGLQEALDAIVEPGDRNVVPRRLAQPTSALRVVSEAIPQGVYPTNPSQLNDSISVLGIVIQSGTTGETVNVQVGGVIEEQAWSWLRGLVFVGPNGTLTQTPPETGFEIVVGYSPAPTKLNLQFREPIQL